MTATLPNLTRVQENVLRLAGQGLSTQEIADELGVTHRTAKHHLDVLRGKFGVSHKRRLVAAAQGYFDGR